MISPRVTSCTNIRQNEAHEALAFCRLMEYNTIKQRKLKTAPERTGSEPILPDWWVKPGCCWSRRPYGVKHVRT